MIVVLKHGVEAAKREQLIDWLKGQGLTIHISEGEYQTVLANILATPLKMLAPLLVSHVQQGGHLVLAGILERQADELKEAYAPYIELEVADSEDGWILMTAHKQS